MTNTNNKTIKSLQQPQEVNNTGISNKLSVINRKVSLGSKKYFEFALNKYEEDHRDIRFEIYSRNNDDDLTLLLKPYLNSSKLLNFNKIIPVGVNKHHMTFVDGSEIFGYDSDEMFDLALEGWGCADVPDRFVSLDKSFYSFSMGNMGCSKVLQELSKKLGVSLEIKIFDMYYCACVEYIQKPDGMVDLIRLTGWNLNSRSIPPAFIPLKNILKNQLR